jgi:hypothetical protein
MYSGKSSALRYSSGLQTVYSAKTHVLSTIWQMNVIKQQTKNNVFLLQVWKLDISVST